MKIDEIKELIGDRGLTRDVAKTRQAWIEYGGMLLDCPHTQGAKIGQWVRDQGLDFVEDPTNRSKAKELAELTLVKLPMLNLDDCPYSSPAQVLQWLRKTGQIEVKQDGRSKAVKQQAHVQLELPQEEKATPVAVEVAEDDQIIIQPDVDRSELLKWSSKRSRYIRGAEFEKFSKEKLDTLKSQYGVQATEDQVEQIAQVFSNFMDRIEGDPLLVALVIQKISVRQFNDVLKDRNNQIKRKKAEERQ